MIILNTFHGDSDDFYGLYMFRLSVQNMNEQGYWIAYRQNNNVRQFHLIIVFELPHKEFVPFTTRFHQYTLASLVYQLSQHNNFISFHFNYYHNYNTLMTTFYFVRFRIFTTVLLEYTTVLLKY